MQFASDRTHNSKKSKIISDRNSYILINGVGARLLMVSNDCLKYSNTENGISDNNKKKLIKSRKNLPLKTRISLFLVVIFLSGIIFLGPLTTIQVGKAYFSQTNRNSPDFVEVADIATQSLSKTNQKQYILANRYAAKNPGVKAQSLEQVTCPNSYPNSHKRWKRKTSC